MKATDEPWHPLMICCASDYGRYYCIESGTLPAITLVVLFLLMQLDWCDLCSFECLALCKPTNFAIDSLMCFSQLNLDELFFLFANDVNIFKQSFYKFNVHICFSHSSFLVAYPLCLCSNVMSEWSRVWGKRLNRWQPLSMSTKQSATKRFKIVADAGGKQKDHESWTS